MWLSRVTHSVTLRHTSEHWKSLFCFLYTHLFVCVWPVEAVQILKKQSVKLVDSFYKYSTISVVEALEFWL